MYSYIRVCTNARYARGRVVESRENAVKWHADGYVPHSCTHVFVYARMGDSLQKCIPLERFGLIFLSFHDPRLGGLCKNASPLDGFGLI